MIRTGRSVMLEDLQQSVVGIMDRKLWHLRRRCPPDITDLVFLEIERNRGLLRQYEQYVGTYGLRRTNISIGGMIRKHWDLQNLGRCSSPRSRLIGAYEKHANRRRFLGIFQTYSLMYTVAAFCADDGTLTQ
jgi:hypothetical protein